MDHDVSRYFDPADQPIIDLYAGLTPDHWRWKWRIREAAHTQWHGEYGAYYPAVWRSWGRYNAMKITAEEQVYVDEVVQWMEDQSTKHERWW